MIPQSNNIRRRCSPHNLHIADSILIYCSVEHLMNIVYYSYALTFFSRHTMSLAGGIKKLRLCVRGTFVCVERNAKEMSSDDYRE